MPEWCVDWECEVEVSLPTKTYTVGRSEIFEAETAEEALRMAEAEALIQEDDVDVDFAPGEMEVGPPENFRLARHTRITEFKP